MGTGEVQGEIMFIMFVGTLCVFAYHTIRGYISFRGELVSLFLLAMLYYWFVL